MANLVVIPSPGMGHLVPAMELAKQLVARDPRLSITVLLTKHPIANAKLESYVNSFLHNQRITIIDMPLLEDTNRFEPLSKRPGFLTTYMEAYRSKIKDKVEELRVASLVPVVGLLVDMFCTTMIDVATELGLSSYVLFPSGASFLQLMFHLQGLGVDVLKDYDVNRNPDTRLEIPGFKNLVPVKVWPGSVFAKEGRSAEFLRHAERYRLAKGILVNTFSELERDLIRSMSQDSRVPPIYPVGPIINLANEDDHDESFKDPIMRWLDAQPPRSVVFLCFGSRGSFDDTQVKEIAVGLERSGRRFLWSLRLQPDNNGDDVSRALPEGFMERTREQGRVIGWAPQVRVLAHEAVGAFVSHCGWNSTLESLWYSVPIAAWPISAEQQLNAFMLVKELGLATEIRIDYRQDLTKNMVVEAAEVEEGIRKAMEDEEVKKKVKEMSDIARKALREGGSSHESFGRFIEAVFKNLL